MKKLLLILLAFALPFSAARASSAYKPFLPSAILEQTTLEEYNSDGGSRALLVLFTGLALNLDSDSSNDVDLSEISNLYEVSFSGAKSVFVSFRTADSSVGVFYVPGTDESFYTVAAPGQPPFSSSLLQSLTDETFKINMQDFADACHSLSGYTQSLTQSKTTEPTLANSPDVHAFSDFLNTCIKFYQENNVAIYYSVSADPYYILCNDSGLQGGMYTGDSPKKALGGSAPTSALWLAYSPTDETYSLTTNCYTSQLAAVTINADGQLITPQFVDARSDSLGRCHDIIFSTEDVEQLLQAIEITVTYQTEFKSGTVDLSRENAPALYVMFSTLYLGNIYSTPNSDRYLDQSVLDILIGA